jgi:hypothetical protein
MEPQNQRAPFHLPLLHILVEERVGVRRFPSRFIFMGMVVVGENDASLLHGYD